MRGNKAVRTAKRALLGVMVLACGSVSACGFTLQDAWYNVNKGVGNFIAGYTTSVFNAIVPAADELL